MADRIIPQDLSPRRDTQPERPGGGMGWLVLLVVVAALIGGGVWMGRSLLERSPESEPEMELPAEPTLDPKPSKPPPVAMPPTVKEAPPPTGPEAVGDPARSPAQMLLDRQRAEAALTDYLATKRELDQLAVLEWGGEDYARILLQIEEADAAFSAEQFSVAADGYEAARRAGEQLVLGADDALPDLLARGRDALAAANGAEAERSFAAALAIRPDAEDARIGLRRSATIERTAALLETGRGHEADRLYELALTDFEEAARLDPLHEEARAAANAVREVLREQTFREAMSDALGALREGRLEDARRRILQARALRPDAPEVRDVLFQITEAERAARIAAMGEKARDAEAIEDWEAAHDQYREVLAIDPTVQFAREGAERCSTAIRDREKMQHFIEQPALLSAPDGRATARLLVTEVNALGLTAPKLNAQAETLTALLVAAETPVSVSFQSDGFTRVDIYQVGRFPPFRSMPLELLPGTYTVVGHRAGFRDVRLTLEVRAGAEETQVTVECREKI